LILDSHCHAWERWPYEPQVPDPDSRARVEQLLYEMDRAGVEKAVLICARIGDNPGNVDYAFEAAVRHEGRLVAFPDIDCRWSADYRAPGAAARLEAALARWPMVGFTHYLDDADDGQWLNGKEGRAFFALADAHRQIVSISAWPHQVPAIAEMAARHPAMPILIHHRVFLGPRTVHIPQSLRLVLAAADRPNIFIKLSGMGNAAGPDDEFPYPRMAWVGDALYREFGATRMLWGSDYPVSRRHMTYAQTLAMLTRHGPMTPEELPAVLGGTMARLLDSRRV
jgi:L-fuconolactonase